MTAVISSLEAIEATRDTCILIHVNRSGPTIDPDRYHSLVEGGDGHPRTDCRLSGRKTSDRDSERGAGHVIEADLVAEGDRLGVASVLSANPAL